MKNSVPWLIIIVLVGAVVYSWASGEAETKRLTAVADSLRENLEKVEEEVAAQDELLVEAQSEAREAWEIARARADSLRNVTVPEPPKSSVSNARIEAALDSTATLQEAQEVVVKLRSDNEALVLQNEELREVIVQKDAAYDQLALASQQAIDSITATYEERLANRDELVASLRSALEGEQALRQTRGSRWADRIKVALVAGAIGYALK